jgi:hypothetical protein
MGGGGRVYGQGCVSALPRWAVRLGRGAIRDCAAQVAHFAGLRIEAGCSTGVALVLQLCVATSRASPIWHVYPMGARRVARWIFVGCGAAGRGILKDRRISRAGPFAGHPERSRGISLRSRLDKRRYKRPEEKSPAGGQRYEKRNDEINSCRRASCVGGNFAQGDPAES